MYASPTWCTHAKKKKRHRSDRVWHSWFDFTERSLHRAGATHVLTVAKGIISQVFRCFCKRNAFLRVGKANDRFEQKSMRIAFFEFASASARFPTRSRATPGQVPRLVQRQTSTRRTRARGWTLSGGRADGELRLLDYELANFVMWISRPRSPVRKCQLGLS